MAEHGASVTVNAPVHQVYELYSHFNDYPKFMTFVKEVTYLDAERSHWVVDIAGRHEWDAVNENWIPDRQIGWRSVDGLANSGVVRFDSDGAGTARVTVTVRYEPPARSGRSAKRSARAASSSAVCSTISNTSRRWSIARRPARSIRPRPRICSTARAPRRAARRPSRRTSRWGRQPIRRSRW